MTAPRGCRTAPVALFLRCPLKSDRGTRHSHTQPANPAHTGTAGVFAGGRRMTPPLPNAENRPIKKGSAGSCSNRFQRRHGTFAPPHMHGCQYKIHFFDPDPSVLGRGQLLIGVSRQQENLYQHEKRDQKQTRHGGTVFPGGDAALALRKKRGFSLCSGAGVRSRVRQSGPLARDADLLRVCRVLFPRGAEGSGIAARRPAATAAARGRLAVKGKPASMRWQGDVMQ